MGKGLPGRSLPAKFETLSGIQNIVSINDDEVQMHILGTLLFLLLPNLYKKIEPHVFAARDN